MLTRLDLRGRDTGAGTDVRFGLPRPSMAGDPPVEAVAQIIADVRARGDVALRELTERFDRVTIDTIRVPADEVAAALAAITPDLRAALETARDSIEAYQQSTMPSGHEYDRDGVHVEQTWSPVERAGCYIPGGLAEYPSSVLMSVLPARVAGVDEIVLCVPPGPDGRVPLSVLAAAALAGVDEVYRVGGAQAIAAMAYGTASVRPVDVIVGPGNIYVATAKRLVSGLVGVPSSFAGPSEVVVVADDSTPPDFAAIDLIVQAEHGPDGLSWLITWSEEAAQNIEAAVVRLVAQSPRREAITATFDGGGYTVLVDGPQAAIDIANAIAPEHLQLMSDDAEQLALGVRHAGAVFVGSNAPASVGDYVAGPSHVLPVYGSARFGSALGVRDFLREHHRVSLGNDALERLAPTVAAIAMAEGLPAHAESVLMRTAAARTPSTTG